MSRHQKEPVPPAMDIKRDMNATAQVQLEPTQREPLRAITGVRIVATGCYLPERVVPNSELRELGCDEEWIVQRTGILERRHAAAQQATSDLALEATKRCLKAASVTAADVDMIIVATTTPDHPTPSTSAILQNHLCSKAAAMDLNAACSGFMYALITGCQFVKTGCCRRVLVVGADTMSRLADPHDKKTYPLFGDGAGAVLLACDETDNAPNTGILSYRLASEGELGYLISVPGGGSRRPPSLEVLTMRHNFLHMKGRPVFKWAVQLIQRAIVEMLAESDSSLDDIDLIIPHQANRRIIDAAASHMNLPPEKLMVNVDRYGNTSAASIPIALDEAFSEGRICPTSRILMCGFGAGLTWGTCVYQG